MPSDAPPPGDWVPVDFDFMTARDDGRSLRVLVVDDNDGFRESLLALLATDDLDVVGEARSGRESLELVAKLDPDIVLMDVRMPSMDGIEATKRLKRIRPSVGVVALTAQDDQDVVRDMLVAGASGYVLKDADAAHILNAVRQAAHGGAVISPGVAPTVIDELTEALERERQRSNELEEAHDALVERIARRHDLVARLGHELRTPVTVIYGVARTLADGKATPEQQTELLRRLVGRSAALVRLVERFETAVDAELTEPVELGVIAKEVANSPRITIGAQPALPAVPLNPILARRVLEELLDNAIRFSAEDDPVEVWIGVVGSAVRVKVMDRGPGIAPRDRDRIFEPLEQGEAVDARVHSGAGVGLSLARAAARAMDGDIVLETSGPGGSTFVWEIPLAT